MGTQGLMGKRTPIPNAVHVNNVIVLYSAYHFMKIIVSYLTFHSNLYIVFIKIT